MRQSNVNVEQVRPSVMKAEKEKERDMYRTSMFQQKEKRYSSGDLEAGSSDPTEVPKIDRYFLQTNEILETFYHLHFTGLLLFPVVVFFLCHLGEVAASCFYGPVLHCCAVLLEILGAGSL